MSKRDDELLQQQMTEVTDRTVAYIKDLESQVRDLTGERERERQALGNLLAVIHRDGGHYQAEHGSKKAAEDAETLVCWLRDNVERLERLMASRIGARIDKK